MQALTWLGGNKALEYVAAAIALFVAALLILLVFRLAFGRRLHMAGGRGRQHRLGIVDAFDLDRQRQLVIVRRDNTEHLIMIGGPNDILIESQIVRAEARELREPRGRDKEIRDKEVRDKELKEPQIAALRPPLAEPKLPLPPLVPEPLQPAAQEEPVAAWQQQPAQEAPVRQPSQVRETAGPARLQPVPRAPTGPGLQPGIPPRRMPPRPDVKPPEPSPFKPEPEVTGATGNPPAAGKPAASMSPNFLRWPAEKSAMPAPNPIPSPRPNPVPLPPKPAAAPPASPNADSAAPSETRTEDISSLEEEMAKLLGREPGKP